MSKKLIVFDLDGTLAPIGRWVEPDVIEMLRKLEAEGHLVAVCSGKPLAYLCGFMRQVGLERPILLGENGACVQFGVALPPKEHFQLSYPKSSKQRMRIMRDRLEEAMPYLWFQPNEVELTPFFDRTEDREEIREILTACMMDATDVVLYEYVDCFDVLPVGISKKEGMRVLLEWLHLDAKDMIAVGDWRNDYPMFELAGRSIGIRLPEPDMADVNVDDIREALQEVRHAIAEIGR